jgi:hypothetical protein
LTKKELRTRFTTEATVVEEDTPEYHLVFDDPPVSSIVRDSAITDYCNAVKIQKMLVATKKRKFFEMKPRSHKNHSSFNIEHAYIERVSVNKYKIISRGLGVVTIDELLPDLITHDCRMSWNGLDTFMLHVPFDVVPREPKHIPGGVCAIDPGVRTFVTVYGSDGVVYAIGKGFSERIDKDALRAQRMRSCMVIPNGDGTYKETQNKRTRKHLRREAKRLEERIKNRVDDFQRCVVKMLTNTYETIIIPVFKTQNMAKKTDDDGVHKRKIGKATTRRLIRMSHYLFRMRLIAKGGERIVVGTEEWTSKTCGNCFNVHMDLGVSKVFECPSCGLVGGRDDMAARNIMLLNWDLANLYMGSTHPLGCQSVTSLLDDVDVGLKRPLCLMI